ncbi:l-lactate dehydrogenase [Alternaria burnsii]|uniref:L-lactate dehydrogenase n=7 Tax=Alternaria TaxID=5598 RepID=A0A8H7B699_9PLEO|nr:l-lactate dehydrogenase [Alternaria burnsii]KAF7678274.1 l-lactate dehydrogenase [Alternaria burnsii]
MDPVNPNQKVRSTPQYALYQRENFWKSNEGEVPLFNTEPGKLEELAKEKLSQGGWFYASSNAGQSHTHTTNRQAFYRHRIIPRMLVDTNQRDTATEIFGHKVPAPIGFAPVGINKIYNPQGELPVARAAGALGLPYCLSTAGSQSIEGVGQANDEGVKKGRGDIGTAAGGGEKGVRFFQLYMPHDDELTRSLLQRAVDSGFTACILTLDTWQLGWRHDDVANSNYAFYHGIGADLGLTDPVFQKRLKEKGIDPKTQPNEAGALWIDNVWHGRAHTWEKAEWAMKLWKELSGGKPFSLKGIQSVEDAKKAADLGFDGIVVSNHAGRQVDGAVASLDSLEKIVDAVGDKIYIMFDSGVRSASDVFKALALGAKFVFVGRLWIWGLSIMGETGVNHVMRGLLADLDILMSVGGFRNIGEITKDSLESGPKSYPLMHIASKLHPIIEMSVILCTAGYDHTIRFWEALSGICSRTIPHPDSQVNRLCISPDKRYLAAAGHHTVKLYDIKSTNPNAILTFDGHTSNITGVAFHCESKWLVTSSEDGTVKIWDTRSGNVQRNYTHGVPVNDVVIHPNQGELISCDRGGNVRIWDLGENKCSHQLIPEDDVSVASVTVASDGSMVCAGNNAGNVYVWRMIQRSDTTSILPICKFVAHTTYITRVLLSPDVRHLATCSADHTARIWSVDPTAPHNVTPNDNLPSASERDPAAFPLETTLHGHQRWVWDCAFSADSAYLVTSCSDHYARLWELGSQSIIRQYNGHHRGAVCVALNDTAVGN